jgi:hypothetical protein
MAHIYAEASETTLGKSKNLHESLPAKLNSAPAVKSVNSNSAKRAQIRVLGSVLMRVK